MYDYGPVLVPYTKKQSEKYGLPNRGVVFRDEQTLENCLTAIKRDARYFTQVVIDTPSDFISMAINRNGNVLKYIKEQTPNICNSAIKKSPLAIQYVINQTDELCMLAVSIYGSSLEYIRNKTPEICMAAIMNDPMSIRYVPNEMRTREMWKEVLTLKPEMFSYVDIDDKHYKEYADIAISLDGLLLAHVPPHYQTKSLCLMAMKNNLHASEYIHTQYIDYVLKKVKLHKRKK